MCLVLVTQSGDSVATEGGPVATMQSVSKRLGPKRFDDSWNDIICQIVEELRRRIHFLLQNLRAHALPWTDKKGHFIGNKHARWVLVRWRASPLDESQATRTRATISER